MMGLSGTRGLHAAVVVVPATLLLGAIGMAALLIDGFLRGDGWGLGEAALRGAGGAAVVLVAASALAIFLWIGQWWTEEADVPLAAPPLAAVNEVAPAPHLENAQARRIGKARALDRWINEGGGGDFRRRG